MWEPTRRATLDRDVWAPLARLHMNTLKQGSAFFEAEGVRSMSILQRADPDPPLDREGLVFFGISDLAGHFRGKGFPASDLDARLARGVGMIGSNIMISAF